MELSRRLATGMVTLAIAGFAAGLGAHLSLARLTDQETNPSTITAASAWDTVPPTISSAVVSKQLDYYPGYLKNSAAYFVYANITDDGTPTSGIATAAVNTSAFDTNQIAVPLVAGSYTVGGVAYNYRSGSKSANGGLAEGSYAFSVTATDAAGYSVSTSGLTVTLDNTKPFATDVQTTNIGAPGQAEIGDKITYTFSEAIDPESILSGWAGAATNVLVRFANNAAGDKVTIRNAANTGQVTLGSIDLVGTGYTTATRDFGATGTPSSMVAVGNTIVITLGTASGVMGVEALTHAMLWSPATASNDRANNACLGTDATESATADVDF